MENDNESDRPRPAYSSQVKIGNWNNELYLKEQKENITAFKRDRCQLLVTKTRTMLRHAFEPALLAPEKEFLEYNQVYQIVACELINVGLLKGLYLSGLINDKDLDISSYFMHGCGLTVSTSRDPCLRNTFRFSPASTSKSEIVHYADDIYIQINAQSARPLYIKSECSTMDNFGAHLYLSLSQSLDIYCRFKILHWNPSLRYETNGSGVSPNSRVIIQHTASGRNLAAENNRWISTIFGAECVVSCHTYQDSHRMETAENIWKIVSQKGTDKTMLIRAAKGEKIADELLE